MATVEFRVGERAHITVDGDVCRSCTTKACVTACPANLFVPTADGGILFNYEQCFECGTCYLVCNPRGRSPGPTPRGARASCSGVDERRAAGPLGGGLPGAHRPAAGCRPADRRGVGRSPPGRPVRRRTRPRSSTPCGRRTRGAGGWWRSRPGAANVGAGVEEAAGRARRRCAAGEMATTAAAPDGTGLARQEPEGLAADPSPLATALAGAIRAAGSPALVVCGDRSAERGVGAVPALLAHHLGAGPGPRAGGAAGREPEVGTGPRRAPPRRWVARTAPGPSPGGVLGGGGGRPLAAGFAAGGPGGRRAPIPVVAGGAPGAGGGAGADGADGGAADGGGRGRGRRGRPSGTSALPGPTGPGPRWCRRPPAAPTSGCWP